MTRSTSYARYLSQVGDTKNQLQVVDAGIEVMLRDLKAAATAGSSMAQRLNLSARRYPALNASALQPGAVFNRVRKNNCEFAIRRCYTHFGEYCKGILRELYDRDPMLVVGKAPDSLRYHQLVQLGSYERIADFMVEQVFKKLEAQRSTLKTIEKLIAGTPVCLPDNVLHEAVAFFEIRHLIVHKAGVIDQPFFDRHAEVLRVPTKPGAKLPISLGLARRALDAVTDLVERLDEQLSLGSSLIS